MVRFECIHCGGRIAVADRRMDRLARCPDCGGLTHPLAEHISRPNAEPPSPSSPCANCGEPLGKLQKTFEWDGHLVCGPCHRMLAQEREAISDPAPRVEAPAGVVTLAAPPTSPIVVVDAVPVRAGATALGPSQLALTLRMSALALCICVVALYLIVSILRSVGSLLMWGAIALVLVAAAYWTRRAVLNLRRRAWLRRAPRADPAVIARE